MNTVHLVLKRKWFDLIASGEKRIEYRADTEFWRKRILGKEQVVFHRGYTDVTLRFSIRKIERTFGMILIHFIEEG